ncbi:hypothetical protein, partial [Streptomyces sp. 6N223]|uniref:hypothetical protein n=1 Tax=Streptomyces sp. 6N223 TaxID=3457412 RepID=UPI003FD33C87
MVDGMVKVLPEAAQLDMVRAAAKLATEGGGDVVRLTDVAWHEPVVVDRDHQVYVDLVPNGEWTVYAGGGRTEQDITGVGSTGRVTVLPDARREYVDVDTPGSLLVELADSPADALPVPRQLAACLAAVGRNAGWGERPVSLLRADEATYADEPGREAVRAVVAYEMTGAGSEAVLAIDVVDREGLSLVRFRGLRVAVPVAEVVVAAAGPGRRAVMAGWSVGQCLEWELKDAVSGLLKLPA